MKTYSAKPAEIKREWFVVDAGGQVLGRLASFVASRLKGKHKPIYTPHVDTGDHIIVLNASKVTLTGNKWDDKMYYRHSGYPGGLTTTPAGKVLEKTPEELIKRAVKGMLPKNKLGRQMFKKLKVYCGGDHPHQAQQPKELKF